MRVWEFSFCPSSVEDYEYDRHGQSETFTIVLSLTTTGLVLRMPIIRPMLGMSISTMVILATIIRLIHTMFAVSEHSHL